MKNKFKERLEFDCLALFVVMPLLRAWVEGAAASPSHSHQLLQGNLRAFPGQLRDTITGKESDLLLAMGTECRVRGRPLLLHTYETHVGWWGKLPRPLPAPSQGLRAARGQSLSRSMTAAFTILNNGVIYLTEQNVDLLLLL